MLRRVRSNAVGATSDVFRLTGVVVLPSNGAPSAARSSLIMRPFTEELRICQRHYAKTIVSARFPASAANQVMDVPVFWPVTMRAAPTVAVIGTGVYNNMAGGSPAAVNADVNGARFEDHLPRLQETPTR